MSDDNRAEISGERVLADIRAITAHTRWMTTPEIRKAADYMRDALAQSPELDQVQVVELPSDGKTSYGGWVAPKSWDVRAATLKIGDVLLADYRQNPFTLMMWSPPTPPGGLTAPVAVVEPFKNGADVRGKFALLASPGQIVCPVVSWLADCGAVGLICDQVIERKGVKEGAYLDNAVQYWNYSNPQWDGVGDGAPRLPAFGLSPAVGRKLREILAANPNTPVHAFVDSSLYDGTMALVTARLPGLSPEEFVMTGHMDEPGASDNASGPAVAMEVMRCLAAEKRKRGRAPLYGVRFYASVEARGLQAFLNTQRVARSAVLAGVNLDMIGYDQSVGRAPLTITGVQPQTPSALEFLLRESCERETPRPPAFNFKVKRGVVVNDCHFSSLPYHAPMCCMEQAPDRTYHSSLDTPENLSAAHLARMTGIVLDAARFYSEANPDEIERAGERCCARAAAKLLQPEADSQTLISEARTVLAQLANLIPEGPVTPDRAMIETMRQREQLIDGYLYRRTAVELKFEKLTAELAAVVRASASAIPVASEAPAGTEARATEEQTARTLVPLKKFIGYLGFEGLTPAELAELKEKTGITPSWAAPGWLQWALDLSSGKRSLLQIHQIISRDGETSLRSLIDVMRWLEGRGMVRFRAYLTREDVAQALRAVGVRPGDIVMAHSSVSEFGYLEGGADALIDALLEAVGANGTLCAPTHSLNWVGKAPYDPRSSPSLTGVVPQRFLKRPGVIRSLHPTHSVASFGPQAGALTDGHDHRVAPQAREGFWGKFVDAGGKVVMLCKLSSNTLLHGGELWGGAPYPPCECHFIQDGKRVEATIPGMPWHVHAFDLVHDELRRAGRLHSAPLGESTVYSMDAREAVETMMRIIQKDPLVAAREGCACAYCNYLRAHIKAGTRGQGTSTSSVESSGVGMGP